MKKIYIALMAFAALAAISCNTKEEYGSLPAGEVMFTAVQADNPESKTILQSDGSVFWSADDSINLFYGTTGSAKLISNNSEPAQQTTFSGSLGGYNHNGSDYFHAVYPYSAENTFDGTAFTVTLPEVQSSVAGSFADDLFISMARSQDYTLQFYNLCGGVKFSVAEAGIKYVTFSGNNNEPLAGKVNVIFNEDGKPVVQTVVDGKTELRLDAPDGGTFEPGEWYYIVSLPATLSAGYTMTFYKDEKFAERITDTSITIKRAVWGRLTNADSTGSESTTGTDNGYEWVDLGLPSGLKWATCNVGANAPEEYGDYFAWGETEPYYTAGHSLDDPCSNWKANKTGYNWLSYKMCNGSSTTLTKYNWSSFFGRVDNKYVLDLEDDAAHLNLGGTWRMPTDAEWTELRSECTWTWSSQNGVNGQLVIGPNGNSIFLPAAGDRNSTNLYRTDTYGYYWSSSLNTDSPYAAYYVYFISNDVRRSNSNRFFGLPVRPVSDESVYITIIRLNHNSITLMEGGSAYLTATVTPSNVTQPAVIWSSSNTSVATVSSEGIVTAVALGTATITAATHDGGYTATCSITVSGPTLGTINGYEWVDLGLPSCLKWATCNVGANAPEEYGDYFAWGTTEPYYTEGHSQDSPCSSWIDNKTGYNYESYPLRISGDAPGTIVYSKYGPVDNKTVLDPEDDAAYVNWGDSWRMPTYKEWIELHDYCTWACVTHNGINGQLATGPNGNSIFLPFAGKRNGTLLFDSIAYYWSSQIQVTQAYSVDFSVNGYSAGASYDRIFGFSIRPVTDKVGRVSVTGVSLDHDALVVEIGATATLSATVIPTNATQPAVSWSSSNNSVATVNDTGLVIAVSEGYATITATTYDGVFTATCFVVVSDPTPTGVAVDLGLPSGLKWASCNVGANAVWEYGDYYAWGETEPYYSSKNPLTWKDGKSDGYTWVSYKLCKGSSSTLIKYNTNILCGTVDNKSFLDPAYDAAQVKWGGNWRMPTDSEWTELKTECNWTWTTQNGVNGRLVTGPNGNSIFLPAAGDRVNTGLYSTGSYGGYWSSSLYTVSPYYAWYMYFNSGSADRGYDNRCYGLSVRPVSE